MARLQVLSDQPDRIALGKGGARGLGGLIGVIVSGAVACIGLTLLAEDGGGLNPVALVIVLVIGLGALYSLGKFLASATVTVDSGQRIVARTNSFFFIPTQQQAMPYNSIQDIQVTRPIGSGNIAADTLPIWQVQLRGTDGSTLLVNDRGTRAEMDALAARVSTLVNRPVSEPGAASRESSSAPYTVGGTLSSLFENLGEFAQSMSGGAGPLSPTISAFPTDSPSQRRDDAARATTPAVLLAASDPYTQASAQMAAQQAAMGASSRQADARMASDQVAAGASTREAYVRLAAEQAAAAADSNETYARLASEQAAASMDTVQTTARLASEQAAAGVSSVQTTARLASEQVAAGAGSVKTSAQLANEQVSAFSSDLYTQAQFGAQQLSAFSSDLYTQAQSGAQQLSAGVPFVDASARLAQQQAAAAAAQSDMLPPVLSMPQMPDLVSFPPVLDLPAFAPLSTSIDAQASPLFAPLEIKEVKTQYEYRTPVTASASNTETSPLLQQARSELGARNYKQARETYLRALGANPADASAQNDLGVVYYKQNKMPDAERAFRRTVALDPFTVEGRYNLGLVLQRLGRRSEAHEQFRVGASSTGGGAGSQYFQQALRGELHDPLLSA